MAEIQDRKRNLYSSVQSVKDESGAPLFLESAGDVLIKDLAKKQTSTKTSLEQELRVTQNFEKGFQLEPCEKKGLWKFRDFLNDPSPETCETKKESKIEDIKQFKNKTGISRHELQLASVEKPNSDAYKLYQFAVSNKPQKLERDDLNSKLANHPINHLKEIEEEHFGYLRNEKRTRDGNSPEGGDKSGDVERILVKNKKKKARKRRKKAGSVESTNLNITRKEEKIEESPEETPTKQSKIVRPSLWDVRDVKAFAEGTARTCEPPKPKCLYTIKDGKIVKLSESGNLTEPGFEQ